MEMFGECVTFLMSGDGQFLIWTFRHPFLIDTTYVYQFFPVTYLKFIVTNIQW